MASCCFALASAQPVLGGSQPEVVAGRATVIDGDTIEIRGQRIRLFGIDAPEGGQTCTDAKGATYRCGQRAAQALDYRISDSPVTCDGPLRPHCRCVQGVRRGSVGLDGWARLGARVSPHSTQYVPAEELAQRRKAGMWSGRFEPPWEWRAQGANVR